MFSLYSILISTSWPDVSDLAVVPLCSPQNPKTPWRVLIGSNVVKLSVKNVLIIFFDYQKNFLYRNKQMVESSQAQKIADFATDDAQIEKWKVKRLIKSLDEAKG